ncbi:unnamed protein product, partial [Iphiclides podalirius]
MWIAPVREESTVAGVQCWRSANKVNATIARTAPRNPLYPTRGNGSSGEIPWLPEDKREVEVHSSSLLGLDAHQHGCHCTLFGWKKKTHRRRSRAIEADVPPANGRGEHGIFITILPSTELRRHHNSYIITLPPPERRGAPPCLSFPRPPSPHEKQRRPSLRYMS